MTARVFSPPGPWEIGQRLPLTPEESHYLVRVRRIRPGEPVVVMGPTGTPTEIPHGESVMLAGGGLGNAVLFSIAICFCTPAATTTLPPMPAAVIAVRPMPATTC